MKAGDASAKPMRPTKQRPYQAPGRHCPACDGPVTSECFHTTMTSRERRRMAKREGKDI